MMCRSDHHWTPHRVFDGNWVPRNRLSWLGQDICLRENNFPAFSWCQWAYVWRCLRGLLSLCEVRLLLYQTSTPGWSFGSVGACDVSTGVSTVRSHAASLAISLCWWATDQHPLNEGETWELTICALSSNLLCERRFCCGDWYYPVARFEAVIPQWPCSIAQRSPQSGFPAVNGICEL